MLNVRFCMCVCACVHNLAVLQAHQSINLDRSDLYIIFTIWKCYIIRPYSLPLSLPRFRCCFVCAPRICSVCVSVEEKFSIINWKYDTHIKNLILFDHKFVTLKLRASECEFFPLLFFWCNFFRNTIEIRESLVNFFGVFCCVEAVVPLQLRVLAFFVRRNMQIRDIICL